MDFFTHIVINSAIASQFLRSENNQRAFILGGIVPDLDVIFVWIPLLVPQLFIFQHRGIFHTIFAAPFIVVALILSTKYFNIINFVKRLREPLQAMYTELNYCSAIWGILGVFVHLILDCITPGGLLLFYPVIQQRITLNLISYFDPIFLLLSSIIVLRFIYHKLISSSNYSFSHLKKSARPVFVLFVFLLTGYGILQFITVTTYSPMSTQPEFIPIFRWVSNEDQNTISIRLIDQLTQQIVRTFNYSSLTYNPTDGSLATINIIIRQAKDTLEYQKFKFQQESEAYLAINVTLNTEEARWEVSFLDTFQDAQFRFYGIPNELFMIAKTTIFLPQP
jgi:inner membrane protein